MSSNAEMAHQLYVLQSLLLGLLDEKRNNAADPNDQVCLVSALICASAKLVCSSSVQACLKDITELRRIAFDSEGDMSPSVSKKHGFQKDYKKLGFQVSAEHTSYIRNAQSDS